MQRAKPKLRSMMSESGTTGDDHLQPLAWKLRSIVGEDNVLVNEPMSEHTSFEIGGPADLFVIPEDFDEVHDVIDACKQEGVPYFVLGRGSDLLVADEGYRGVIVAVADGLVGVSVDDDEMWCQAGVTLREASEMACELGLSGLEFACGIPGSIGGACFMNAGAYGGCMADVLKNVHVLHQDGHEETIPVDELDLGYRHSRIADEGMVVLSATFDLDRGDPEKIRETMDELTRRREEKQPLELPSAGSTFKRPEGYFVGKLVTDAGLRGYQVGGAAVSKKHAGFVVNVGGATAADVRAVIAHVQDEVERQFGVRLEPEVRFLG
jgi:UDP-N-acetylmuramate dehydrogenase